MRIIYICLHWLGSMKRLIAIFLISLALIPKAQAQYLPGCVSTYQTSAGATTCSNEGTAWQWRQYQIDYFKSLNINSYGGIANDATTYSQGNTVIRWRSSNLYNWFSSNASYPTGATCNTLSNTGSGQFNAATQGDIRCFQGCQQTLEQNNTSWTFSGTGGKCSSQTWGPSSCPANYAWNQTFGVCSPQELDTDGDGVPDSIDQWPFDPERTIDTDGDGVADEFDAFPADPTQHSDTDGDGVGDDFDFSPDDPDNGKDNGVGDETDNTSTGGGNCSSPPVSNGDAIQAQIAYQTWKTNCSIEKLNKGSTVVGDVANCSSQFSCTGGDPAQCAQLYALRVEICPNKTAMIEKLEQIKTAIQSSTSGTGSVDSETTTTDTEYSDFANQNSALFEGAIPDIWGNGDGDGDEFIADSSGFGWGSTCPQPPTLSYAGQSFTLDFEGMCSVFQIIGLLILLAGFVQAVYIMGAP